MYLYSYDRVDFQVSSCSYGTSRAPLLSAVHLHMYEYFLSLAFMQFTSTRSWKVAVLHICGESAARFLCPVSGGCRT